jgi:hypothetical protein
MHPVRNSVLTEDDFEFVHDLERDLLDLQAHLHEEGQGEAEPAAVAEKAELVSKLTPVPAEPAPELTEGDRVADAGEFIPSTKSDDVKKTG